MSLGGINLGGDYSYVSISPNSETVSYFLHVDFNVFLEIVAVQIEH